MKAKIYSLAAIAFTGMMVCSAVNYAQTAAATPKPATAQAFAIAQLPDLAELAPLIQLPALAIALPKALDGQFFAFSGPMFDINDTAYTKKMQKLQEKMKELQKQMHELKSDEVNKASTIMQEKMSELNQTIVKNLEKTYTYNYNFKFNYDSNNEKLKQEVLDGDVKEKVKNYSKSYPADKNDELEIDNRYGKITVNTWAKNEFKVDVQIKAYANDDAEAQKLLDQTSVVDSKDNDVVSFKTTIKSPGNSWETIVNDKTVNIHKVVISYTVYMPAKNALTINNKFGSTELPDLDGKITINNSNGSVVAKSLSHSDNVIMVKNGDVSIGSLTDASVDVSSGDLSLDAADKVNVDMRYGAVKIGKINTSGTINVRYGDGIQIIDLGKNLKTLSVNSNYAPVKLGLANNTNANFDVTVHYKDFIYNNNAISVTSKTPGDEKNWSATQTYKGHIGKGSTDKTIIIKANYGDVKFE